MILTTPPNPPLTCTKTFKRESNLQRHYRIHTNERPYVCTIPNCGKSFIQRGSLMVHIRTHTGEKPYQCQHLGCGKRFYDSSSLNRHRRIHTGERPYKCAHDGCLKSYRHRATMVKHHKDSHQRGMHPNELLDDCTSDPYSGESPSTPKHAEKHRPTQSVMPVNQDGLSHGHIHRATSFGDFGQQTSYLVPQQQQQPHYAHWHSFFNSTPDYHGIPEHQQQPPPPHAQHPGIHVMHRTASMPHPYYVTEHTNPGVAAMNTQQLHPQYQMPRQQQVDGLPLDIPCQQSHDMNPSIQNSPTSCLVASGRSLTVAESGSYRHMPIQCATYALQNAPLAEHQPPQQGHMAQFHQRQGPHPHPIPSWAPQAPSAAKCQAPKPQQQQQHHEPQQP